MLPLDGLLGGRHELHVAQQDRAYQTILVEDKAEVAAVSLLVDHLEAGVLGHDLTDAEHVEPEDLERIGSRQAAELRAAPGKVLSGDFPLSLGCYPKAVDHSRVLRHVPGRQDIGMRGGHAVVDHHAVLDLQPRLSCQRAVGPDARGDDHQVRRNGAPVLQQDAVDSSISEDFLGDSLVAERYPDPADMVAQDLSCPLVQLSRQEPSVAFQQGHLGPTPRQRPGSLQAEYPPTDANAASPRLARREQVVGILERAQAGYPFAVRTGDGRDEGIGTGGQQELVERESFAVTQGDGTALQIEPADLRAEQELDIMLRRTKPPGGWAGSPS